LGDNAHKNKVGLGKFSGLLEVTLNLLDKYFYPNKVCVEEILD